MKFAIPFIFSVFSFCMAAEDTLDESNLRLEGLKERLEMAEAPADSLVNSVIDRIELTAGTEKQTATLKVGSARGNQKWAWSFSTPVEKGTKTTNLATLDGLADAITAGFEYSRVIWNGRPNNDEIRKAKFDLCSKVKQKFGIDSDDCDDTLFDRPGAEALGRQFRALLWTTDPIYLYGFSGKLGHQKFEYLDADSLEAKDVNENPWSIGAHFARLNHKGTMFSFGYRREHKLEDNKEVNICTPLEDSELSSCEDKFLGAPKETDSDIVFVEIRRQLKKIAISPKISFDFETEVTGIDVPVYLFRDKKANFTGGLRVGWRDDTRDLNLALFIGNAFKLFK